MLLWFIYFLITIVLTLNESPTRIPVKILTPDDTKTKLIIVNNGLNILRQMPDNPVSVITFIGRARSGKSFTLNNILHIPYDTGFEVGHSNNPKTIGADIWPFLITPENSTGQFLVFDTEGLGTGPHTYDKALLLLFTLISSRIVYHLSEYVYTDDISKLYSVACLASHYESRGILSRYNISLLPSISWVVQKYRLKTESPQVAMDEWLGEKDNIDNNPFITRFNATVKIVRTLFPNQTVHLIPPADRFIDSHTYLTDIPRDKLIPEYLQEMSTLEQTLFSMVNTPFKVFTNKLLATPNQIADAIIDLLPAANLGFEYVGDKVTETLSRTILTETISNLTNKINNIKLPVDTHILESLLTNIRDESLYDLEHNLPLHVKSIIGGGSNIFRTEIESHLLVERTKILKENEYQSDKLCSQLENIAVSFFASPERLQTFNGNIAIFEAAYDIAMSRYHDNAKGPASKRHELSIKIRSDETRQLIGSVITPRRKIIWSVSGTIVILCTHFVITLSEKCVTRFAIFIYVLFSIIQFIACGVVLISVWSIFDVPPITFETLTNIFKPTPITIVIGLIAMMLVIIVILIFLLNQFFLLKKTIKQPSIKKLTYTNKKKD